MKRFQKQIKLFSVITILISIGVGCVRNIAVNPTTPGVLNAQTSTPTLTGVPTNTLTSVPTNTITPLPTSTLTGSPTPSNTPPGNTNTPTNTSTVTLTFTDTNTPPPGTTNTFTTTPTPTACTPILLTSYTFDSSTQCWTAWAGNAQGPTNSVVQVDTTNFHTGPGALEVIIPFSATMNGQVMIGIDFSASPVAIPTGSVLSFYYMSSTATGNGQLFDTSGTYTWDGGSYQSTLATTWTKLSFTMNPATPGSVQQIGFQIPGATGTFTSPVTIWIDDVTISPPATPTPTPVASWTYESNTVENWSVAYAPSGATVAVTTLAGINGTVTNPTADPSTYGLDIHFPAITAATNDAQVECNSASGSPIIGTGMNWVSLNITSVAFQYWVSPAPGIGNYDCTVYPYVRAGGGGNNYGGNYNGWTSQSGGNYNGSSNYLAANTWQKVSFNPSGGTWTTDETNVTAVGVDANLSYPNAAAGGDIVIDNVTLQ